MSWPLPRAWPGGLATVRAGEAVSTRALSPEPSLGLLGSEALSAQNGRVEFPLLLSVHRPLCRPSEVGLTIPGHKGRLPRGLPVCPREDTSTLRCLSRRDRAPRAVTVSSAPMSPRSAGGWPTPAWAGTVARPPGHRGGSCVFAARLLDMLQVCRWGRPPGECFVGSPRAHAGGGSGWGPDLGLCLCRPGPQRLGMF